MKNERSALEEGETSAPPSRHHCPKCGHVTGAPRGAMEVVCGGCGVVVDTREALRLINLSVGELEERGRLTAIFGGEYAQTDVLFARSRSPVKVRDFSDDEIFYRLRELANRIHHLRQVGE